MTFPTTLRGSSRFPSKSGGDVERRDDLSFRVYLFLQVGAHLILRGGAISLIGTFAGRSALGFSINTLTLFDWSLPLARRG